MNKETTIRVARLSDAPAILEIYKPFILETAITFEEHVPQLDEFKNHIAAILKECPFLVCEINGVIVGYAYASSHRSRAAYRWSREVSVYVHPAFRRKNIAKALYHTLFSILKTQAYTKLFGVITLPNNASIALHESFGFKKFGEYKNIGFKLGRWHHVGWWELCSLDNMREAPAEPIPFNELEKQVDLQTFLTDGASLLKI